MNINEIIFNNLEMIVSIPEEKDLVNLIIADYLALAEEELSIEYREKIIDMLERSSEWYSLAQDRIHKELSERGELMSIYLLSEQNSDEFKIGLLFRIESDIEHGRGMKISIKEMNIIEYGYADAAFS